MSKTSKTVGFFTLLAIIYLIVQSAVGAYVNSSIERRLTSVVAGCPLCQPTIEGDLAKVRRMLTLGADPNASSKTGITALMAATDKGHTEIVEILIAAGANPDAALKVGVGKGITPLMSAAMRGNLEMVKAFIAGKANLDLTDIRGITALMFATRSGSSDVAKVLLDAGADANLARKDGLTALMLAAIFGRVEMTKMLLAAGANPNTVGETGITTLMMVALVGNAELFANLLKEALPAQFSSEELAYARDKKIQEKMTALLQEGRENHPEVVKALIAAGADLNAKAENGLTALDFAREYEYIEVVRVLEAAGAR